MQLTELSIKSKNLFVQDYIDGNEKMSSFFDYDIHASDVWEKRLTDLSTRTFAREALVDYLLSYHEKFESKEMIASINKLRDPSSVAVVGGQQAGLLTGPLYTIHKIISILVFAHKKEEELNVPVVPIFWVAGEDHDIDEINFVYISEEEKVVKKKLSQSYGKKSSAASTLLDKEKCQIWIDEIFTSFQETDYTNKLLANVQRCLKNSSTFTDFFEQIVVSLFQYDGLILLNSGDPGLKKLEINLFQEIVHKNHQLTQVVLGQQHLMQESGYAPIIECKEDQANLFYEFEEERFLIEKEETTFFIEKLGLKWTKEDLLTHIEEKPELFSNNVVTRPLMQEFLIPTLAFIAGPGEINYWGELKQAFHLMNFDMTPVVPRLNITFVERHIEKKLLEREISILNAIENGTDKEKSAYFESRIPERFTQSIVKAKEQIENIHSLVRKEALYIDESLEPLLQKNAGFIQEQLSFAERVVTKRIEEKEGYILRDYNRIQNSIKPLLAPQERIWNLMYFLNKYGPEFFEKFKKLPFSFQNQHYVVKL